MELLSGGTLAVAVRPRCMGLSPPAPQMTEWVVEEANTPHSLLQWKTNKDANQKKRICRQCDNVALVIPQMGWF